LITSSDIGDAAGGCFGLLGIPIILFVVIQWAGTAAVIGQRWNGQSLGTIAYNITNANGCQPFNGFAYLEQGARSHAFKSIQTMEFIWPWIASTIGICIVRGNLERAKLVFSIATITLVFPVWIYECSIAGMGRPVVMSGNCMLVELDPSVGFLNSEIDSGWKWLVSITGL
jgi:hypothetical protein